MEAATRSEDLFATPESVRRAEKEASERVIVHTPQSNPTLFKLQRRSAEAEAHNLKRAEETLHSNTGGGPHASAVREKVSGFGSLMPFLRKAMVRLHPDVLAAPNRAEGGEATGADASGESMRNLLKALSALEVLAVDPAGSLAELQEAMDRRRAASGLRKGLVRGSVLLGSQEIRIVVPAAARMAQQEAKASGASAEQILGAPQPPPEDITVRFAPPPGLLKATEASEQEAVRMHAEGRRPATAVVSSGLPEDAAASSVGDGDGGLGHTDATYVLSAAPIAGAALPAPAVRAQWLSLASRFAAELCTALGMEGVTLATFRLSKPVRALQARQPGGRLADSDSPAAEASRRVPRAGSIGLEPRESTTRSQARTLLQEMDHRSPHSVGKIRANPWQPLDQERVTTQAERDGRVALLISPERLSSAFIGEEQLAAGRRTLTAVLYEHFEAIQLQDPFWQTVRFVIGAGYDWEPSQMTVYVPWNGHSRQTAAYLRDLAPSLLLEARKNAGGTLRARDRETDTRAMEQQLRKELRRQDAVRRRRAREAQERGDDGAFVSRDGSTGERGGGGGGGGGGGSESLEYEEDDHNEDDAEDEARMRAFGMSSGALRHSDGSVAAPGPGEEAVGQGEGDDDVFAWGSSGRRGASISGLASRMASTLARGRGGMRDEGVAYGEATPRGAQSGFGRQAAEAGWQRA